MFLGYYWQAYSIIFTQIIKRLIDKLSPRLLLLLGETCILSCSELYQDLQLGKCSALGDSWDCDLTKSYPPIFSFAKNDPQIIPRLKHRTWNCWFQDSLFLKQENCKLQLWASMRERVNYHTSIQHTWELEIQFEHFEGKWEHFCKKQPNNNLWIWFDCLSVFSIKSN